MLANCRINACFMPLIYNTRFFSSTCSCSFMPYLQHVCNFNDTWWRKIKIFYGSLNFFCLFRKKIRSLADFLMLLLLRLMHLWHLMRIYMFLLDNVFFVVHFEEGIYMFESFWLSCWIINVNVLQTDCCEV